jgi:hypothetical protein
MLISLTPSWHAIWHACLYKYDPVQVLGRCCALAMWGAILLFMNKKWTAGVVVWSVGVGIKMTVLLLAPAIAMVTVLSLGLLPSIRLGIVAMLVQVCLCVTEGLVYGQLTRNRFYWQFPSFKQTL